MRNVHRPMMTQKPPVLQWNGEAWCILFCPATNQRFCQLRFEGDRGLNLVPTPEIQGWLDRHDPGHLFVSVLGGALLLRFSHSDSAMLFRMTFDVLVKS